jgi:HK97 family phage major capsid protein
MVPQGFWENLQVAMRAYGGVLSSIRTVDTPNSGAPMPWPTVDPTNLKGYHLSEMNQLGLGVGQAVSGGTAMVDLQFGQGMLASYTAVSGVILASLQLLQDSAFNVDEFVNERMSEAIGRLLADVAVNGTGSNQGLGIQTALVARGAVSPFAPATGSSGGVYAAAGGSVSVLGGGSANSLTAGIPTANDLELMTHCIDPAYSANAKWFVSDQGLSALRRVANSFGEPLLQDPANGDPPTLWSKPVEVDPNLGAVSTTASTVGGILYGDMSRAMVYRRAPAGVLRLAERYADYLQVGFLSYQRYDIRSNDLRAAVIYKSPAA